jgi:uncharacterized repeat protein (TIGR03803 family)
MRIHSVRSACLAGAGLVLIMAALQPASAAAKLKQIYSFCSLENCADGVNPRSGLVADPAGNLYGITALGGANGNGTIFELVKGKKGYKFRLLYTLAACDAEGTDCPDGKDSHGPMVIDTEGSLYGTFDEGGGTPDKPHAGVIFRVVPGAKHPYRILHAFCTPKSCADGANPASPLTYVGAESGAPYDGTSLLYGATANGGAYGGGTTFTFTPAGGLSNTGSFCHYSDTDHCDHGRAPSGALAVSDGGSLYGANVFGPQEANGGLIWGAAGSQLVHVFKDCQTLPCSDGFSPSEGVSLDQSSNALLGTTYGGGANGKGTAYGLDIASGKHTFQYPFCHKVNCTDGETPTSTLYVDGSGKAYGTTAGGGDNAAGVLYQIDLATTAYKVLHSFCSVINENGQCSDGALPQEGVISVGGNLFGVTQGGGNTNTSYGIAYELTP